MLSAVVTGLAVVIGFVLGWLARGRAIRALESARARDEARVRSHVVPVLVRRATSLDLGRDGDVPSAIDAAVEIGKRIQKAEEKLVLPFSDTLEMSRAELARPKE